MSRAKSNRSPQRTPAKMKPRPGDLFADQQDRQRELGLGDPVDKRLKKFKLRVAALAKGLREHLGRKK